MPQWWPRPSGRPAVSDRLPDPATLDDGDLALLITALVRAEVAEAGPGDDGGAYLFESLDVAASLRLARP